MRLVGHPMIGLFGHCVDQLEVSRLLAAIAKVAFSCIHAWEKTNTRDGYNFKYAWPILNAVSVFRRFSTRRIGIFPFVFFLFVCLFVFYGIAVFGTPQCPPLQLVHLREVIIIGLWLGKLFVFWIYIGLCPLINVYFHHQSSTLEPPLSGHPWGYRQVAA